MVTKSDFWTMQIPVLSTGHLKQHTLETIDQQTNLVAPYDHGSFVYIGDDEANLDGWPEDLQIVAKWLWEQPGEMTWIRFDSDGEYVEDLPQYEW